MKILPIENEAGSFVFECPGCKSHHKIQTSIWQYNGNAESPTVSPSILVRSGHYLPDAGKGDCWCDYRRKNPNEIYAPKCTVCHSFVNNGKIQFLSDCTHALAGQTVDLPEID